MFQITIGDHSVGFQRGACTLKHLQTYHTNEIIFNISADSLRRRGREPVLGKKDRRLSENSALLDAERCGSVHDGGFS
jgi:hypothetical protein